MRGATRWMALLSLVAAFGPAVARAQDARFDAAKYFDDNCGPCHTIGGGQQAGPDLKNVTARKDRRWLIRFVLNPESVVNAGDDYAKQMVAKYDGLVMPAPDGLTKDTAEQLVEYIERTSHETTAVAPPPAEAPAFTDQDRARGLEIFTGRQRLANAGPSCIACHELGGLGGMRGGMVGPDLAGVSARLGGARGLTAWLGKAPTPVMRAVFRRASLTDDESRALAALFDSTSATAVAPTVRQRGWLLSAGLAGAIVGLVAIGGVWTRRFRGVRRRLLDASRGSGR